MSFFENLAMAEVHRDRWKSYCADPIFQQYLLACRNFDPLGFDRALKGDEESGSFDFRDSILEAYIEDTAAPPIQI